jgi:hypothetical protein
MNLFSKLTDNWDSIEDELIRVNAKFVAFVKGYNEAVGN